AAKLLCKVSILGTQIRIVHLSYRLPDANAILDIEVHLLTGCDGKRGIPRVEVADSFHSILSGCVAVRGDLVSQGRIAHFCAPALTVADEESLVAGHSFECRRRCTVQ